MLPCTYIVYRYLCYLFLIFLFIPIGLIIGRKLYQNIKKEELHEKGQALQRIMKTYIVIQSLAWPLTLSLMAVVPIIAYTTQLTGKNSALEVLVRVLISITRFLYVLILSYVGFNSLIVAICRYIFIVVVQHNDSLTIKKIRSWVIAASIVIPVMLATLHEATIPLNKRLAMDVLELMLTPENSTIVMNSSYPIQNITIIVHQSPIFTIFDEYVPPTIKFVFRIACNAMKLAIFSNIFEGCIYLHIYIYNRRSENKINFDACLSEESKIKRHRTKTINLHMAIVSWSIEFVGGLSSLLIFAIHLSPALHFILDSYGRVFLYFLPLFCNFIMIPTSYLLNTEIRKTFIIAQGWWKWFKNIFSLESTTPSQNAGHDQNKNPVARSNLNVATTKYTPEESIENPHKKNHTNHVPERISSVLAYTDENRPICLKALRNNYL